MSSQRQAQAWKDRADTHIGGAGVGGDATSVINRKRDLAAYERMKAALPKKPPKRISPEEAAEKPRGE